MRITTRRRLSSAMLALGVALALVASVFVGRLPATAATPPPPVSQVRVIQKTDHQITIQFAVPAAYYHPGARAVVRITRGKTPAASPTAGYEVRANTRHEAQAGPNPALGAGVAYTFALWIIDGGQLSKRATLTTTTLKDTTPPEDLLAVHAKATINSGPRVVLDWANPCCDELDTVRIVRNTKPTTVGGNVFTVPAAAQAWVDDQLPASIVNNEDQSFSADPLYYWLRIRDKAGHYSLRYVGTKVVVGSRTISGTVTGKNRFVVAYCCNGGFESRYVTSLADLNGSVNGGRFSLIVPPGRYTICTGDMFGRDGEPTASCWVPGPDGTGTKQSWSGFNEDVPPDNIDLRSTRSYDGVRF